ncbi:hypothetical protein [Desulfopila sp. IMCC35006]|nr:hypothetical protein [Desulfopila sp. IMCC35006]
MTVHAHAREEEALRSTLLGAFPSTLEATIDTTSNINQGTETKAL